MLWHLLHQIDQVFRPNTSAHKNREYPISWKNLGQGYVAYSTRKTVLVWDINTTTHLLRIPPKQQKKAEAALATISRTAHTTSLHKWRKILGLLRSITPAVTGSRVMFTRVKHSIQKAAGQNVHLTADVHDELEV